MKPAFHGPETRAFLFAAMGNAHFLKIDIDSGEIGRLATNLNRFSRQKRGYAIHTALERTAKQGLVSAARGIRANYNLPMNDIKRRFDVYLNRRASMAYIRCHSLRTNRIPLIKFGAKIMRSRGKATGVRVKIVRSGKTQVLRHAFLAKMSSGHEGIFTRERGSRKIKEVMGIDAPAMLMSSKVEPAVTKRINEQLQKNMVHELQYQLSKFLGK